MPVASYKNGTSLVGPKEIHAPKRADLKYWYRACIGSFPELPPWNESMRSSGKVHIDEDTIIFNLGEYLTLFVSRRRNLR